MFKKKCINLTEGEKREVLHCGIIPRFADKGHWHTKDEVIKTIRNWDWYSNYITVSMIEWDADKGPWGMRDDVRRLDYAFDLYKGRDLDLLVGLMFQASIDGYTIRYVSSDCLTGFYLERTKDVSSNIDEDVVSTLVELVRDRWERDS